MKPFRYLALIFFAFNLGSENAYAYQVKGAGGGSCGQYLRDRIESPKLEHLANMHWVFGFISGVNYARDQSYGAGVDLAGIESFIDSFCRDNPLENLAGASEALIRALQRR